MTTQYIAEKDASDTLKVSYTNGLNEVISRTEYGESTNTVFFLYDANCSVNAIVDEAGELVKTFDYEEFGLTHPANVGQTLDPNNQNAANNKMLFAGGVGHPTDDSGLVYMRARYYDPASGRFISEDPAGNGTNWYVYCGNNPVNLIDFSGEFGNPLAYTGGALWLVEAAYLLAELCGFSVPEPLKHLMRAIELVELANIAGAEVAALIAYMGSLETYGVGTGLACAAGITAGISVAGICMMGALEQLVYDMALDDIDHAGD